MAEPTAASDAPEYTVHLIFGMCMLMPEALRLYGHPGLLAVAASINGDDFVPYNDAIFVKKPGQGASVGWHQDGATTDSLVWHADIHGFNLQVQHMRPSLRTRGSCPAAIITARPVSRPWSPPTAAATYPGRRPAGLRRRRRHDRQPPNRARLVREQLARSARSITSIPRATFRVAGKPGWPLDTPIPSTTRSESAASSNHPGCHRCPLGTCRTRHPSSIPFANLLTTTGRGRDDRWS